MKAAVIDDYGTSDDIKVVDDAKEPSLSSGKVIVKVRAASINPFDYKVRDGMLRDSVPLQFPKVLGMDLSGEITELGEGVDSFKVGDKVYGQADFFSGGGSIAEYTTANSSSLYTMPTNLDFNDAASIVLTAVSAYQALIDNMNLSKGQKILIHGGAGGIGSLAIQLAKHIGAYVATTSSARDKDYVIGLGADEVIDYETEDFSKKLKDYDCVLDLIGGDVYRKSFLILKDGGVIVSLLEQPDNELSEKYHIKARHQSSSVNSKSLEAVTKLVEAGAIKPQVAKVFKLNDVAQAFSTLEKDHPRGKVVICISE